MTKKPELLLAHEWKGQDPTGWWISEKLDGVRAYWDGKHLYSRLGNRFAAPKWFTAGWPSVHMDGELWMGRKRFDQCSGAVRRQTPDDDQWAKIKYLVFDLPLFGEEFEQRLVEIGRIVRATQSARERANGAGYRKTLLGVAQAECTGLSHLEELMDEYTAQGAEGLMLREPGSLYVPKRSNTLLKVKKWQDADGVVVGYEPGKGKHKGRLGALIVSLMSIGSKFPKLGKGPVTKMMKDGPVVYVGTGFTDQQRENPPKIGSVVTYKFFELTKDGVPRFPSFVRERKVS